MHLIQAGDLAMLVAEKSKPFILRVQPGAELQTHRGSIRHDDLIGISWGSRVKSHLEAPFLILEPTLRDLLLRIRRRSQIIFPKDIGYILLRLSIGPGKTVVEAGTGSGSLTTAFAWSVGPEGKVISYDRREDMTDLARSNLERVGLEDRVILHTRDIEDGFDEQDVEALFLDLPRPHLYLPQVSTSLRDGGNFGAVLPTTNQVSQLLAAFEQYPFALVDVCEISLRFYKPIPERLRPVDRMVAHTGYLVFARKIHSMTDVVLESNSTPKLEPSE
ncbi:MAG: tRNA (adenine-N1)-methyltransferase [Anaerolineales bacterium]